MDSRGIAKTTIRTLGICGLALAVATSAGAQVHTDSDGYRWHTDKSTGQKRHCAHYGPSGDLYYLGRPRRDGELDPSVICPGEINPAAAEPEKPGLVDKARGQWEKAKEKASEIKDAFKNPFKGFEEFTGDKSPEAEEELPWRQPARSSASTRSYERSAKERPKQPCEKVGFAVAGENCIAWCFEVDDPYPGKNCYVRDAWFAEKRKAEELEKKARGAESSVRRTKTVSLPLPLHPAQPAGEQPWCHEIVNPLPPVNCIEYIPPAASASGAGTTINVHAPAAAEADPFDSVYDNYKSPTASRFGRVIGRAIKQKAERDRRKAEHRRLLSTLDRREGRTGAPKTRSAHQAAVGATGAPHKTLAPSGTVQPPPFYSAAEQARVKEIDKERRAKIEMQKKQWAEQTKAYQRAKAAKPKSYAVKPTDYSRKSNRAFEYPKFGPIRGPDGEILVP